MPSGSFRECIQAGWSSSTLLHLQGCGFTASAAWTHWHDPPPWGLSLGWDPAGLWHVGGSNRNWLGKLLMELIRRRLVGKATFPFCEMARQFYSKEPLGRLLSQQPCKWNTTGKGYWEKTPTTFFLCTDFDFLLTDVKERADRGCLPFVQMRFQYPKKLTVSLSVLYSDTVEGFNLTLVVKP